MDKNQIMDKEQIARELLDTYINPDGSMKELTGSSAKAIQELFKQGGITVKNPQDLEELITSIDGLVLSGTEKLALKNLGNIYKEQYPKVLEQSIEKKNDTVKDEMKEREFLNQTRGNISSTESSEQLSEGASKNMKTMMKEQYDNMKKDNKPYPGDLEKLQSWKGLDYREEVEVKIINVPGFFEVCSIEESGTQCRDMDKDSKRSVDNVKDSDNFRTFAKTIENCEMMELSDIYKLMNVVAGKIGIPDTIDEKYINSVFKKYENKNLPIEHPFGRILRALYMMTGGWFVIRLDDRIVRSVYCDSINAGIYDYKYVNYIVRSFAKIGGSH